jgi:hypothetical protein
MQTIQINNPEIENFLTANYGNDTQSLLNDFVRFVKLSLDDGYPVISNDEVKKRVTQAVDEVKSDKAVLLTQEQYDEEMNDFLRTL